MNRKAPKVIAIALSVFCVLVSCGSVSNSSSGSAAGLRAEDVSGSIDVSASKPASITMMVDGTLVSQEKEGKSLKKGGKL